jgi:hypothetical protein
VNLIHLFNFYLAVAFLLSTYRRVGQYRAAGALVVAMPQRWPRLLKVIRRQGAIFLTWSTFKPALVALALLVVNTVLSNLVWPRARLTPADLLADWPFLPLVALAAAAMLAVDGYFIIRVGQIDRLETEKYLDEAEYWLRSWKAPVIKALTLGRINPHGMVEDEVQKAMLEASGMLRSSLWWTSLQTGCRVAFGLALWLTWAVMGAPFAPRG